MLVTKESLSSCRSQSLTVLPYLYGNLFSLSWFIGIFVMSGLNSLSPPAKYCKV